MKPNMDKNTQDNNILKLISRKLLCYISYVTGFDAITINTDFNEKINSNLIPFKTWIDRTGQSFRYMRGYFVLLA